MRDEFAVSVRDALAKRVGFRCSNPACCQPTSGPTSDATGVINVGVAAHITAAAVGGPRYDAALSVEERRSADNGIWLCQKCAKLIDSDVIRYSSQILRTWRKLAEQVALAELESRPGAVSTIIGAAEAQFSRPPRPWLAIDGYSSEVVEHEMTGQEDLWESIHIVNRGEAPAVSIVVPEIRLAGWRVGVQRSLPTLGSGEDIDVAISNLRQTLERGFRKMPAPSSGGPRILRIPLLIEYHDLDYKRWTTEHALSYSVWGISFAVVHPNDPQEWTGLSLLEQQPASA